MTDGHDDGTDTKSELLARWERARDNVDIAEPSPTRQTERPERLDAHPEAP